MYVHNVFFWLKDDVTQGQSAQFAGGLESLRQVETVKSLYAGPSIPSQREVVDSSFSFGLTVLFDDVAAHDAYQVHPLHDKFVEDFAPLWAKVVVHDSEG